MNKDDIFLWPDGFWCFRDEYTKSSMRDENYRLIAADSAEWLAASKKPAIPSSS